MTLASRSPVLASRDYGLAGRGSHLVIPSVIGPILAAILVFNRAYWRLTLVNSLGHDDIFILLSLIFLFAECIVNLIAVDHGYGRPSPSVAPEDLQFALKMFYLTQILYKVTINLTKLSILTLYLRIFAHTTQRWFRLIVLSTMIFVTLYSVSSIVVTIFQCNPVPRAWHRSLPGTCINTTAFWYSNGIYNIFTDLIILLSVPGVIWSLHLPLRQRLALTGVFGLGIFVFATSILRFTTLKVSSRARDSNAGTLISTMWTTIEASCAVVCACLPMVRTPLQKIWPKIFPNSRMYSTSATVRNTDTNSGGGGNSNKKRKPNASASRVSHSRPTSSQRAMADLRGETIINPTNTSSWRGYPEEEEHDEVARRATQMMKRRNEQDLELGHLPSSPRHTQHGSTVQQEPSNDHHSRSVGVQQQHHYQRHQLDGAGDDYDDTTHHSSSTDRVGSIDSGETDWFAGLPIRPWSVRPIVVPHRIRGT